MGLFVNKDGSRSVFTGPEIEAALLRNQKPKDKPKMEDMSLFDSDTGKNLETLKEVDVTAEQTRAKKAVLLYTKAKRGRIVQLQSDGIRIHYFLDEIGGQQLMIEDSQRFGFHHNGMLCTLAKKYAPD